jgi:hypothetical protein
MNVPGVLARVSVILRHKSHAADVFFSDDIEWESRATLGEQAEGSDYPRFAQ